MELTKWPRLLVVGERVTEDQAAEIIVRTTAWPVWVNDRSWAADCNGVAGFEDPEDPGDWHASFEQNEARRAELGVLELEYLHNGRVASAWIGGTQGWVDWTGQVGCSTYNIGKWPTTEEVRADLTKIAAAWPYLAMDVQVVGDEGAGRVLAGWRIGDGEVFVGVPPFDAVRPVDELPTSTVLARVTSPFGERCCTLDQLRHGVELASAAAVSP